MKHSALTGKKVARWHGRVERPKCSRIRSMLCLVARLRFDQNTITHKILKMILRLGRWWGIEPRSQFHRQCFYPFSIAENTSMP